MPGMGGRGHLLSAAPPPRVLGVPPCAPSGLGFGVWVPPAVPVHSRHCLTAERRGCLHVAPGLGSGGCRPLAQEAPVSPPPCTPVLTPGEPGSALRPACPARSPSALQGRCVHPPSPAPEASLLSGTPGSPPAADPTPGRGCWPWVTPPRWASRCGAARQVAFAALPAIRPATALLGTAVRTRLRGRVCEQQGRVPIKLY